MRFNRRLSPNAKPDLIPMIDIVFQLVVFFMLASTLRNDEAITINYPESTSAETVVVTKMQITLRDVDQIFFNGEQTDLRGLTSRLRGISEEEKSGINSVLLRGDKSISYELMVLVLDELRLAGFEGVSLKTIVAEE
jgi:biopolymer transport protein ExbD